MQYWFLQVLAGLLMAVWAKSASTRWGSKSAWGTLHALYAINILVLPVTFGRNPNNNVLGMALVFCGSYPPALFWTWIIEYGGKKHRLSKQAKLPAEPVLERAVIQPDARPVTIAEGIAPHTNLHLSEGVLESLGCPHCGSHVGDRVAYIDQTIWKCAKCDGICELMIGSWADRVRQAFDRGEFDFIKDKPD